MDLSLTAEQRLLVDSARSYLARDRDLTHVRAMESDARGYDPVRWHEMAALGWLGMALGQEYGGSAQTVFDLVLLLEQMGRVLAPSPFLPTVVVAAPLLEELADDAQRRRWLPALGAGELVVALALAEPGWRDESENVALEAQRHGEDVRLSGRKLFVPFAAHADLLLVAARIAGAGTSLLAIEPTRPGVACRRLSTFGGEPLHEVAFDAVAATAGDLVGPPGGAAAALERARQHAAVGTLAMMVGGTERVLEMTVEYAKTRTQFGRPIGSFQAVAHRCVDMRSDLDALRYLVYQAAWCLAVGRPSDLEVAAAKAYGNEALRRIYLHAHQVHGAIGFSTEHDLHLFTRRAKAAELQWGSTAAHRERVARAMGL